MRSRAGLAVDADPDLHLVLAELERRLAGGGHGARGQRHAHRSGVRVHLTADVGDLLEGSLLLRRSAGDLLQQDGGADASPSGRVEAVLHGDVVVDQHGLHLGALGAAELGGHLEVHHVAGVVLDDVEHAGAAVDGLRRRLHLVRRRRREDLARDTRRRASRCRRSPPCMGSCPEPPPDTSATLPWTGASLRTIVYGSYVTLIRSGCAASIPCSASRTTFAGSLMSFFIASPSGRGCLESRLCLLLRGRMPPWRAVRR